jgi:hypothetical protein
VHVTPSPWHGLQSSVLQDQSWNSMYCQMSENIRQSSYVCYTQPTAIRQGHAAASNLPEPTMPQILRQFHFQP